MLPPTSQWASHRTLSTGTVVIATIFILLTLYNLRDAIAASSGSPVRLSGHEKDTARIPDATTSTSSSSHGTGNEQDTIKISANNASSSNKATSSAIDVAISSAPVAPNEPRRAFVTFLEADTGTNHNDQEQGMNPDDEDIYFVGMLHPPSSLNPPNH